MTNNILLLYGSMTGLAVLYIYLGSRWRWIYLTAIIPAFVIPGLLKVVEAHFVTDIATDCKRMCDLTPIETAFYFFSYSPFFIKTVGLLQLFSGLLLFFKKYRLIGLLFALVQSTFINLLTISFWGISTVTIFMIMISASIILYLYKDFKDPLMGLISKPD